MINVIDINTRIERIRVITRDNTLCLIKLLDSLIWYEALNASIRELTPLVEKYSANRNPMDKSPPLGLFIISSIVVNVIVFVNGGNILEIKSIRVFWKSLIGMYGIRVNTTIIEGKNARKKLNANEDARVVIEPFIIPFQKNIVTSYMLNPENPGGLILFVSNPILLIRPINYFSLQA